MTGPWAETTDKGEDTTLHKVISALHNGPQGISDIVAAAKRGRTAVYGALKSLRADGIVLYCDKTHQYRLESARKLNGEPEPRRRRFDA